MTNKTCLSVLVLTDNIHANNLKEELEFLINRNNGATCTSNAENPPEVVVIINYMGGYKYYVEDFHPKEKIIVFDLCARGPFRVKNIPSNVVVNYCIEEVMTTLYNIYLKKIVIKRGE
ncbi:MAG: hypothetical protein A2271_03735 [Candidatus Moranbacteria bacterium RIFOXYA12_FULL_35_19]|nr:MAG: hypothetical protein UR78_C0003G0019 [Candidatus Moranbacteria bacterium GW2011_GWF2_35_39]OGI31840.1 MAG: hypothetical protein A2343_01330 [Candidatus Moranbacteria bacterium RIFOXYB12_FULL_35_8]OGI33363.1 MAG: hypothetical protein A2489_03880 [Candidatus Moranbacteria bacterium RIFOXYC12_FULL_36_13]OGI36287.1 MAG: hypothetical protein A2271_03735 [Candidatus Moranbacteria bacterium RIFOXYA12_FULL_35_19]